MSENSPVTLTITVTKEDIAPGRIAVSPTTLRVVRSDDPRDADYYGLPPEAIDFISRFDAGRSVEPFTFTVEAR